MSRPSGTTRILHVDDETGFAVLTATSLEHEGDSFDVTTAMDASEGLERLREGTFDCIVSDYEMPKQNGLEFLDTVRSEFPDIPFILFTGRGSEEIASEAISAGVTDYVQKESGPNQFTVLANRISNAVEQHQAKRRGELSRRAMDTATEGLSLVEPDGTFSYVNPAFAELFEYDPDELTGEHWSVLYHDETAERLENDIIPAVMEQGYWSGETVRLTKAGERLVTDHRLSHTAEDAIVCTARDVTPERTNESRQMTGFNLLVDAMEGYAFFTLDHEGYITRWNEGAERLTGYSTDEILGAHIGAFFTEADRQRGLPEQLLETAKTDGRVTDMGLWVRHDGSQVKTVDTLSASFDASGTIRGFGVMVREAATDPIAEALDRKTSYLDAILEYTTRPMFMKDTTGEYLLANREFESLFDLQDGEAIGLTDHDIHPDTVAEDVWANDRRVLDTEEPVETEERVVTDGEERVYLTAKVPVYFDDASSEPDAVFGMATEITDREERERELEAMNAQLEELTSVVSHDLRSPLSVAEGYVELAKEERDEEHLERVEEAHDRLNELIENLLESVRQQKPLVRGASGQLDAVTLPTLVQESWENVSTEAASLDIETSQTIAADRSRLAQLLENLVRNAVEHGGPDVTVTVGDLDDGFYVADDGPGIPEDERDTVFEKGYSTDGEGVGLGLHIVESVADAHNWNATVTDSNAGGTRFEITGISTE